VERAFFHKEIHFWKTPNTKGPLAPDFVTQKYLKKSTFFSKVTNLSPCTSFCHPKTGHFSVHKVNFFSWGWGGLAPNFFFLVSTAISEKWIY
jgi:hypothetical protein